MKPSLSRLLFSLAATMLPATLCMVAPGAAATAIFAQSNQTVAPAPADARRLSSYFTPPYQAGPLPPAVEEILLRDAPESLHAGCAAMVDGISPAARGSARVSVQILAMAGGSAWVAYRCASRLAQFQGLYRQRLAVFNAARATLQFLDLKANQDAPSTLYHVGLAETVKLRGAENSAAFEVFALTPSRTPAGSSPRTGLAENRLVIIANSATTAKPVLSVVTARQRIGTAVGAADDAQGNAAGAEYLAKLRFDHDLSGHLTGVGAYFRDGPAANARYGSIRYAWNPAALTFVVYRPKSSAPAAADQSVRRLPPVPGYHQGAN